jgi:hypothetical protein
VYEPIRTSLLPLPYGETTTTSSGRQYGTLQEEATRISTSLIPVQEPGKASQNRYGSPAQPVPLIKSIIQVKYTFILTQKKKNQKDLGLTKLTIRILLTFSYFIYFIYFR